MGLNPLLIKQLVVKTSMFSVGPRLTFTSLYCFMCPVSKFVMGDNYVITIPHNYWLIYMHPSIHTYIHTYMYTYIVVHCRTNGMQNQVRLSSLENYLQMDTNGDCPDLSVHVPEGIIILISSLTIVNQYITISSTDHSTDMDPASYFKKKIRVKLLGRLSSPTMFPWCQTKVWQIVT